MTSPMTGIRDQPAEREPLVLAILPYGMLAFCVLVSFSLDTTTRPVLIGGLIISAVSAAWILWMFTLHPRWRRRPGVMAVFITGLTVLGALLIIDNTFTGCTPSPSSCSWSGT